jgi:hypothetical protein
MAIATFPYVSLPLPADEAHPQGSIAHRPLAFATIIASNGASTRSIVMPDSGAQIPLAPYPMHRTGPDLRLNKQEMGRVRNGLACPGREAACQGNAEVLNSVWLWRRRLW